MKYEKIQACKVEMCWRQESTEGSSEVSIILTRREVCTQLKDKKKKH